MDKLKLETQIKEISSKIISNSNNAEYAKKLIDELLSFKGQYDIEEVVMIVPSKDVLKEYDNNNLVIFRCKDKFIWKHKGGFGFFVDYRMTALFEYLKTICDMKDKYEELPEEMKSVYNGMYFGMGLVAQLPMFVCVNEQMFFNVVSTIMEELKKLDNEIKNSALQEETPEKNAEFETKMKAINEMLGKSKSKN